MKMKMKLWKQQMLLQHIALWELEVQKRGNKTSN